MVFIDIAPSISDVDVGESRRTIMQNRVQTLFSGVGDIIYFTVTWRHLKMYPASMKSGLKVNDIMLFVVIVKNRPSIRAR